MLALKPGTVVDVSLAAGTGFSLLHLDDCSVSVHLAIGHNVLVDGQAVVVEESRVLVLLVALSFAFFH